MKKLFFILTALLIASCNIFDTGKEGEAILELSPDRVKAGEEITLLVRNLTNSDIYFNNCSYRVETQKNGKWHEYTGVGCAHYFPVFIDADDTLTLTVNLFVQETGTYRIIAPVGFMIGDSWKEKMIASTVILIEE